MKFLAADMVGWDRIWAVIFQKYGSASCQNPISGEVWQYLGSTETEHQFRHRDFLQKFSDGTTAVGRKYENIPVLLGDFDVKVEPEYEYTTRTYPTKAEVIATPSVADGWSKVWADVTTKTTFVVFRRTKPTKETK
jgi:hypothetical protein